MHNIFTTVTDTATTKEVLMSNVLAVHAIPETEKEKAMSLNTQTPVVPQVVQEEKTMTLKQQLHELQKVKSTNFCAEIIRQSKTQHQAKVARALAAQTRQRQDAMRATAMARVEARRDDAAKYSTLKARYRAEIDQAFDGLIAEYLQAASNVREVMILPYTDEMVAWRAKHARELAKAEAKKARKAKNLANKAKREAKKAKREAAKLADLNLGVEKAIARKARRDANKLVKAMGLTAQPKRKVKAIKPVVARKAIKEVTRLVPMGTDLRGMLLQARVIRKSGISPVLAALESRIAELRAMTETVYVTVTVTGCKRSVGVGCAEAGFDAHIQKDEIPVNPTLIKKEGGSVIARILRNMAAFFETNAIVNDVVANPIAKPESAKAVHVAIKADAAVAMTTGSETKTFTVHGSFKPEFKTHNKGGAGALALAGGHIHSNSENGAFFSWTAIGLNGERGGAIKMVENSKATHFYANGIDTGILVKAGGKKVKAMYHELAEMLLANPEGTFPQLIITGTAVDLGVENHEISADKSMDGKARTRRLRVLMFSRIVSYKLVFEGDEGWLAYTGDGIEFDASKIVTGEVEPRAKALTPDEAIAAFQLGQLSEDEMLAVVNRQIGVNGRRARKTKRRDDAAPAPVAAPATPEVAAAPSVDPALEALKLKIDGLPAHQRHILFGDLIDRAVEGAKQPTVSQPEPAADDDIEFKRFDLPESDSDSNPTETVV